MKCKKCNGRMLLDRVFTDNQNLEASCLLCGVREFIPKDSDTGKWLTKLEERIERITNGLA